VQAREVLLRVRRSAKLLLKVPRNSDERVKGNKAARMLLRSLTAAPIEATKKYEIIDGSAPDNAR
jgi:hypothetical protein